VTGRDPYRDPGAVRALAGRIARAAERLSRRVTFMEVCGTHTHAIAAAGLRALLPPSVRLISGPGCPVCVTPVGYVDHAEALAGRPGTVVCTFGDLMRVPSSTGSLERARAEGADIRVVYSPRDALTVARDNPGREVVFLGVGFETTTPTVVGAILEAEAAGVVNLSVLSGHKTMPAPLRALAADPDVAVDGLLCPGHVSVITGWRIYEFLPAAHDLGAAVVGFAPTDVLQGVLELVEQVASGAPRVANLYGRAVTAGGNPVAQAAMDRLLGPCDAEWRGLGTIPGSGLALRPEWVHRDAARFEVELPEPVEPEGCRCGEVLRGVIDPPACPLFGAACDPASPVGACMVSSEGTCAAWYRHGRLRAGAAS
jgi:hydrogenase expression/formation protein HypD